MPLVIPTQRWMGPTVRIPRLGEVRRRGNEPVNVTDGQAAWLFQRFMAKPMEETTEPPLTGMASETTTQPNQETTHQPNQETTHQTGQEGTLGDLGVELADDRSGAETEIPAWQTNLLAFFNTAETKEEIATAIKGIGPKTAEDLIQERPLDWEKVDQVLSNSQIEAAKVWVEKQ